ncbi:MAG: acyl-CoA thioesterase [Sedimentisphaerales bacterium]|nr:acyl-CoA thioesterase [Sedimentisphaerales bacterium]
MQSIFPTFIFAPVRSGPICWTALPNARGIVSPLPLDPNDNSGFMDIHPIDFARVNERKMQLPEATTIQSHTITIIPRYCETDQAGVVHHTVYPIWFEMGRTELLRANGVVYSELEKTGVFFVVFQLTVKYHRPAYYDEPLELTTICTKISPARVEHSYQLKRKSTGLLLAEGVTILACVDKSGRLQRIPDFMQFPNNAT